MLGLLLLTNVVIRAVLTAPGPFNLIHAEVPNLMIGTFPFMFIPGFFVPLAVVLHLLAVCELSLQLSVQRGTPSCICSAAGLAMPSNRSVSLTK